MTVRQDTMQEGGSGKAGRWRSYTLPQHPGGQAESDPRGQPRGQTGGTHMDTLSHDPSRQQVDKQSPPAYQVNTGEHRQTQQDSKRILS